jgi:hypothetical protein
MKNENWDPEKFQGKSKKQVESSTIGCFIGSIGMFLVLLWLLMLKNL